MHACLKHRACRIHLGPSDSADELITDASRKYCRVPFRTARSRAHAPCTTHIRTLDDTGELGITLFTYANQQPCQTARKHLAEYFLQGDDYWMLMFEACPSLTTPHHPRLSLTETTTSVPTLRLQLCAISHKTTTGFGQEIRWAGAHGLITAAMEDALKARHVGALKLMLTTNRLALSTAVFSDVLQYVHATAPSIS